MSDNPPISPWLTCPDCYSKLRVTHVAREERRRVTKHACSRCSYKMISVSEIVIERPHYGEGFNSLAKKLRTLSFKRDVLEP